MGTDELQAYVMGVMSAKHLSVSEVKRRTGISRPTLTAITKGRYTLGSERTRDTLERLADGLEVPRAEMLAAAGLAPEPEPSTVPEEMMLDVFEAQRQLSEAVDRLYNRMKAEGRDVPPPPKPSGGPRTPRTPPPPAGPRRNRRKDNPGTS